MKNQGKMTTPKEHNKLPVTNPKQMEIHETIILITNKVYENSPKNVSLKAPGWFRQLTTRLLVLAQVMGS